MTESPRLEAYDPRRALRAPAELVVWNDPGVLSSADINIATRLAGLVGEAIPIVVLAAALAVRAVRLGHVCVDLATIASTASSEVDQGADLSFLPWPMPSEWERALSSSSLVSIGDRLLGDGPTDDGPHDDGAAIISSAKPFRLVGSKLYLERYWREERLVAEELADRSGRRVEPVVAAVLREGLDRLFAMADSDGVDPARLAATVAVTSCLTVVAGGPGTGKTTAVARMLALIEEQSVALGKAAPRIALAAPTGKAAARLAEAVHLEASGLDVGPGTGSRLANLEASTIHRLLGWRRDTASRFRHNRYNPLPHDVIVVDEASMLSLSMMSRLLEALRPDARLILVGDPGQLASVEAGAVLGDLVGPATSFVPCGLPDAQAQGSVQGQSSGPSERSAGRLADVIVVLRRVHRFGGGIAELADAAGRGDADAVVNLLRAGRDDLRWLASTGLGATYEASIRPEVLKANRSLTQWACEGRLDRALAALSSLGVLCAYRHGPSGARSWNERIARWLAEDIPGRAGGDRWYPGRPLLITENDHDLGLYNGDTGVVATGRDGQLTAVFDRRPSLWEVAPARLRAVETVHAMTVHKSQGSQFDEVILVLPEVDGPLLSRELLYTALTRARRRVSVVGPEAVLRAALDRAVARASGLRERLWGSTRGTE